MAFRTYEKVLLLNGRHRLILSNHKTSKDEGWKLRQEGSGTNLPTLSSVDKFLAEGFLQVDGSSHKERFALVPNCVRVPTGELNFAEIRQLSGVAAMFREVLRLYPPVGYFPREAMQDHEIRGAKVKKGDALLVFPWLLHRHRRWWREPDVFNSERFLNKDNAPVRGTYLPFGLGARACIGARPSARTAARCATRWRM